MTRAAAILAWVSGFGFGLPGAFGLRWFIQHREVWMFMGFPTYGHGPFERWGISTNVPLLVGFIAVCAAELAVGVMLWSNAPIGLWLSLALVPFEVAYWIGFALPFGPILGLIRTVLVLIVLSGR